MTTRLMRCSCQNEGQDKLHGKDIRVFNKTAKDIADSSVYRCTVCCKEVTATKQQRKA